MTELPLPEALLRDLKSARPLSSSQRKRLGAMLTAVETPLPTLYDLRMIQLEQGIWSSESVHYYLGQPHASHSPGDIDPRRAVIIGEAGFDEPIVLDYRVSPPRVVYLGGDGHVSFWVELATDYESLISAISAS